MTGKKEISRLARITSIATMLKSKRILTAADIAKKFDISIRTVYRDIRTLESSGVPVITIDGKGYSIMDGYTLPPLMFTEAEANALITAEHLINKTKDTSLSKHFQDALVRVEMELITGFMPFCFHLHTQPLRHACYLSMPPKLHQKNCL